MPTATSFTALGNGNGFPFCLNHQTESQLANKTNAEGKQKKLRLDGSLGEIMKIFWNLYSFRIEADLELREFTPVITKSMDETVKFYDAGESESLYEQEYGFSPFGVVDFANKPSDRCAINTVVVEGFQFQPTGDGNNTFYSFYPEFYYNTTSKNYAIIFDFEIEMDLSTNNGQVSDVYTSDEEQLEGSNLTKTVNIFGTDYELYSKKDEITITDITVTDEYFEY
tara:strand:+ start:52 stop:726 length:675 start_codon:yes stop_codon:yes gene_type:complete